MLNKRLVGVAFGLCLSGVSTAAFAWGLPSLGGGSSSSHASPAQATSLQNKIVAEYALGQASVLKAQSHYALAYGQKKMAARLKAKATALGSGVTTSKRNLQTAISMSHTGSKKLAYDMAHSKLMTAASRKQFAKGTAYYAGGVLALTRVIPQLKPFMTSAQGAIRGASFTQVMSVKRKLATGMFLAENAPSYVGGLVKTSGQIVSYARKNNVHLPASATSALGKLS